MTTPLARLDAAEAVAETCADAFIENAERFTCGEADAIGALLTAYGLDGDAFLASHASGDDVGDQHVPVYDDHAFLIGWTYREEDSP